MCAIPSLFGAKQITIKIKVHCVAQSLLIAQQAVLPDLSA